MVATERDTKREALARDGFRCRRCRRLGVEAAHLVTKGMGGDHGRYSQHRAHYVALCAACHRGARSLHSGDVRAVYGPLMGDGRVWFVEQETMMKRWESEIEIVPRVDGKVSVITTPPRSATHADTVRILCQTWASACDLMDTFLLRYPCSKVFVRSVPMTLEFPI